ncbi:hypothetical protein EV644_105428 [Kribbella orskensis]|uniref:Alpha/beta hydrolase family protein n=1 Tax=Kribbella orskensis TaxID=2512216 RepID=A0ABY2BLY2_9ACTN|nr:hypothetical protein EV642_104428 [Kribbella sp. VKM Ac-2500]TCO24394.1 hypothetical protein EV644_105428 [Kribbella orskensis]
MSKPEVEKRDRAGDGDRARDQLLAATPVTARRLMLAGVSTAVLTGGDGPPIVLLHGPGEFAFTWLRVVPELVKTNRVIVPDLPGHGASRLGDAPLDVGQASATAGPCTSSKTPRTTPPSSSPRPCWLPSPPPRLPSGVRMAVGD